MHEAWPATQKRTLLPVISLVRSLLAMEAVLELLAMEVLALAATLPESTLPASKAQGLAAGSTGPKPLLVELASRRMPIPYLCLCPRRLCPTEILVSFLGPLDCPCPCPFLAVGCICLLLSTHTWACRGRSLRRSCTLLLAFALLPYKATRTIFLGGLARGNCSRPLGLSLCLACPCLCRKDQDAIAPPTPLGRMAGMPKGLDHLSTGRRLGLMVPPVSHWSGPDVWHILHSLRRTLLELKLQPLTGLPRLRRPSCQSLWEWPCRPPCSSALCGAVQHTA